MTRYGQRDIIPQSIRSKYLMQAERFDSVTVYQKGGGKFGEFTDIQQAIDHSSSKGGGIVLVKRGLYSLNQNLYLKSNVSLQGEDSINTILDFNGGNIGVVIGEVNKGVNNVSVSNITVKRANSSNKAISIYNVFNVDVSDVVFDLCTNNLINISDAENVIVHYCYINSNCIGNIRVNSVAGKVIKNIAIESNYFNQCTNPAIFGISNTIINKNEFNACNTTGYLLGANGSSIISNNRIYDQASGGGIQVTGGLAVITGNYLDGTDVAGTNGIDNNSGSYYTITGNSIRDYDVGIEMSASNATVTGNIIYSCATDSIQAAGAGNIIIGNIARDGIADTGSGNVIDHNVTS